MPNGSGGQECVNCTYLIPQKSSGYSTKGRCSYFNVDLPRIQDIVCKNYNPVRPSARDSIEDRSLLEQFGEGFIYEIVGDDPHDPDLILRNGWYAFKKRTIDELRQSQTI